MCNRQEHGAGVTLKPPRYQRLNSKMRRDYFTLDVRGVGWVDSDGDPQKPTVGIDFEGPASLLQERLTAGQSEVLDESAIDVSFRYLTDLDADDAEGVVSITDRVTGDYILELNSPATDVIEFLRAAGEYGRESGEGDDRYRIELQIDGDPIVEYDKRTFLIYNREGNLLREYSLIPSGVEL